MPDGCCAVGCANQHGEKQWLCFHPFQSDKDHPERPNLWIRTIKCNSESKPSKCKCICTEHLLLWNTLATVSYITFDQRSPLISESRTSCSLLTKRHHCFLWWQICGTVWALAIFPSPLLRDDINDDADVCQQSLLGSSLSGGLGSNPQGPFVGKVVGTAVISTIGLSVFVSMLSLGFPTIKTFCTSGF